MKLIPKTIILLILIVCCNAQDYPRIITIDVFADEEYRTQIKDWGESIRWLISDASAYYDTLFSIRFEINSINEWESPEDVSSIDQLYENIYQNRVNSKADIIVGFSFQLSFSTRMEKSENPALLQVNMTRFTILNSISLSD